MASFRKMIVYTKLTGIALVLILALLFIFSNREPVSINFLFWNSPEINKLWFISIVAVISILVYRIGGGIRKVIKDFRQIRKEEKALLELMDHDKNSVK